MANNILIIEDELELAFFLKEYLQNQGETIKTYSSPKEVVDNKEHDWADLIILDLMLGEESGKEFLKKIRNENNNTPVIVTSAMGQIGNRIDLINAGADDFLVKPFDQEELYARISALIRRQKKPLNTITSKKHTQHGEYFINWEEKEITRKSTTNRLTKKEMEVLKVLLKRTGKVTTNTNLIKEVWGGKIGSHSNVLESTIRRLRKKMPSKKKNTIENIKGIGYKFNL